MTKEQREAKLQTAHDTLYKMYRLLEAYKNARVKGDPYAPLRVKTASRVILEQKRSFRVQAKKLGYSDNEILLTLQSLKP